MSDIEGNYTREFDAQVIKSKKDYVALDISAFYPEGGGQPTDTGVLKWDNQTVPVVRVEKKGIIKHIVNGNTPPTNAKVHGVIDWDRRYAHMQMHTAQHIISGVVFDHYGGRTVGNQIHTDYSRVDFHPVSFTPEDMQSIEQACNDIISSEHLVNVYHEERHILEKRVVPERCNLDLLPAAVTNLRIVEVEGYDVCPCAGTHVRCTAEIPPIRIVKKEGKGADRERIIYRLGC
jgi:misacylated tRNA(Ala) deacylase